MDVGIFGLGYVGTVMAASLARAGHRVVGVDLRWDRVEDVARGTCPIVEPGLEVVFAEAVASGRLVARSDPAEALEKSAISFVCVGTPSQEDGGRDVRAVLEVCRQIGRALRGRKGPHVVAIRSTVPPGTWRSARVA